MFFSNHYSLSPPSITAIYKDRWQINMFFTALAQTLMIKTLVDTSPNADKTQIMTVLISMLLL